MLPLQEEEEEEEEEETDGSADNNAEQERLAVAKRNEANAAKDRQQAAAQIAATAASVSAAAVAEGGRFSAMPWKELRTEAVTLLKLAVAADNTFKRSTGSSGAAADHGTPELRTSAIAAYASAEAALRTTVEHTELPQGSKDKLAPKLTMVQQRLSELGAAMPVAASAVAGEAADDEPVPSPAPVLPVVEKQKPHALCGVAAVASHHFNSDERGDLSFAKGAFPYNP